MVESPATLNVARSALKLIQSSDKGAVPPPNDRDPRRVAAHLGDFKVEGEFPPARADSFVTINHNGELVLRAHIVPTWEGQKRTDNIEIVEVRETEWFSGFLKLARESGAPQKRSAKLRSRKSPRSAKGRVRAKAKARPKRVARGRGKATSRAKAKSRRRRSTSAGPGGRGR